MKYIFDFICLINLLSFLKTNFWEHTCKSFCGATDTPVLDIWWCLLWPSKPEWVALLKFGAGICVTHPLRFTSVATPADLLTASMEAEPFSSTYLGLKPGSQYETSQILDQLSYGGLAWFIILDLRWLVISNKICFKIEGKKSKNKSR